MTAAVAVSIIIPLAADETLWRQLLPLLAANQPGDDDEIILAAAAAAPDDWQAPPQTRWLHCRQSGRAAQMNTAAADTVNPYLWFVHADSRPPADALRQLRQSLGGAPAAIHYFDLHFYDGGRKMALNEIGARWRSRLFKNPFGDQALCLARDTFQQLGGYPETAPYGEDHLLLLAAKRRHIPLKRIAVAVGTSARRYNEKGWWRTVLLYQRLWLRQWRRQP